MSTHVFDKDETVANMVSLKLVSGHLSVKVPVGTARVLVDVLGFYGP